MTQTSELSASDLLDVMEELAGRVEGARPVFMSQDVRVERETLLGLINELRNGLPVAIAHADEMAQQAQTELEDARRTGEDIVTAARSRAIELVEQEQVVAQAKSRAADIVAEAERDAERLRRDADEYCDRRLASFQEDLDALSAQVRAGRDRLAERLGSDASHPRWDQVRAPQWPDEHED